MIRQLFDSNIQFQLKDGSINVGGYLNVYFNTGTVKAVTYKDAAALTANPFDIELDNNGRAVVYADNAYVYRMEVFDRNKNLLWTQNDISLDSGIAIDGTYVMSIKGDQFIAVDSHTTGNAVEYDLSLNDYAVDSINLVNDNTFGNSALYNNIQSTSSYLDNKINIEISNRTTADQYIQEQIDNLDIHNITIEQNGNGNAYTSFTKNGDTYTFNKDAVYLPSANAPVVLAGENVEVSSANVNGQMQYTVKANPAGNVTNLISTDESIAISSTSVGNDVTYDLSVKDITGDAVAKNYAFLKGEIPVNTSLQALEFTDIHTNGIHWNNIDQRLEFGENIKLIDLNYNVEYEIDEANGISYEDLILYIHSDGQLLEQETFYVDTSKSKHICKLNKKILDPSNLQFSVKVPKRGYISYSIDINDETFKSIAGGGVADASFWRGHGSWLTYGDSSPSLLPVNTTSLSNKGSDITVNNAGKFVLKEGGTYFYHATVELSSGSEVYDFLQEIEFTTGSNNTYFVWDRSIAHQRITLNLCGIVNVNSGDYTLQFDINADSAATFFAHLLEVDVFKINGAGGGGGGSTYTAGDGIAITNSEISVNAGKGLGFDVDKKLEVKVGDGLAYDSENKVITIDSDVSDVVATVNKLESDLDTKLSVNFNMASITHTYDFADSSVTTLSDGAIMLCQAFTVPINCNIRLATENEDPTLIGIYAKQSYSNKIMLGLYVYDFDTGYTEYVADTGPVTVATGRNEFPIKHINPDITELKSNCVYYAALYLPSSHGNGLYLASCQSYSNASYINATPRFTVGVQNITYNGSEISLASDTTGRLDYNDGNGNYYIGPWSNGYNEIPNAPRFFMQLRNGAAEEPVAVEPFVNIPTYTVSTKAVNTLFTDADQLGTPTYPVVYREVTPQRNVTIDWWQSWSPESTDSNKFCGIIYSSAFDSVLYDISNITVTDLGQSDGLYTRKYTPNSALTLTAGVTYRFPVWLGNLNYTDNCVTYDTPATSSVLQLFQSAWSINQWSSYKRLNDVAAMPLILHDTDGNTYRI